MAKKQTKQISAKQVGKNVILVINDVKHSRAFETKEERTNILELVKVYNEKNTVKLEKELIDMMQKDKVEKEKEIKAIKEKKSSKKVVKKPVEAAILTKEEEIEKAKRLLQENGYNVNEKITPQRSKPRRGEW